jgi:hypothetical protein
MTIDNSTYGFNRDDAGELIQLIGGRDVEWEEMKPRSGGGRVRHAMTKSGGIAARSSLTMGSAACDLYDSSSAGVLSDSGTDVTVYNMATSAIAANTHIMIQQNNAGLWVVVVEDCG